MAMSQLCVLTSTYTTSLVTQGLRDMYSCKELLDLEIFDSQGDTLHAHACVLAAISPVLKGHLSHSGANQRIQRLCFQDIFVSEWHIILDFIYLGEVIIPVDQVNRMLGIVQSLEIEELLDLCKLSLEQSNVLQSPSTAELHSALQNPQEVQTKAANKSQTVSQQDPAAVLQSSRFPQHSLNPGRGSQCPYTKDGTLARHRLAPMATGTITGPFGTVQVSTNELDSVELMNRVNEAFFGRKEVGSGTKEERPRKRKKRDEREDEQLENDQYVKIKTELINDNSDDSYAYNTETDEIQAISTVQTMDNTTEPESVKVPMKDDANIVSKKSKKTLYKCTQCNLELPYGPKLKRHEAEHKAGRVTSSLEFFKCDNCQKEFTSERALNFHVRLNCTPLFCCEYCPEKFHFRYQLDEHCISEHKEEAKTLFPDIKECPYCEETFPSEALLNHHKGRSHRGWKKREEEQGIACPHCDDTFKKESELKQHVALKHTTASCQFCQEEFEGHNALVDHLYECSDAPPGEAEKLAEQIPRNNDKRPGRPVSCPHCQARFPSKASLVRHNDKEHGGKDMTYCTTCNKKFQSITAFRLHMMRHFGIRPHKCEFCEKSFTEASDLLKHVEARHSDDRPYNCPYCDWAFKDVSNLHGHCRRKHKIKLPNASVRRRQIGSLYLTDDDALTKAVIEECLGKAPNETTICVICKGKFSRRGNMFEHAKKIHSKDLSMLLRKAGVSLRNTDNDDSNIQEVPNRIAIHKQISSNIVTLGPTIEDIQASKTGKKQTHVTNSPRVSLLQPVESFKPVTPSKSDLHGIIDSDNAEVELVEGLVIKQENMMGCGDREDTIAIDSPNLICNPDLVINPQTEYSLVLKSLEQDGSVEEPLVEEIGDSCVVEISQDWLENFGRNDTEESSLICPVCQQPFQTRYMVLEHGKEEHNLDFESIMQQLNGK